MPCRHIVQVLTPTSAWFQHAPGPQVKAIEKAAQPVPGSAAVVASELKASGGADAGGEAVAEPGPLANGTAAAFAAADGPAANGSAKATPKRKRAEAATTVSEPANGAATPSEQQRIDKPRKKSKAKAAGDDAAAGEPATEANGDVLPSTAEVAKKRKKVSEPTEDVSEELAARVAGQQSGKKTRRKSNEDAQPADAAAGTAPQQQDAAITSQHASSQTPKQDGESRKKAAKACPPAL